MDGFGAAVRGGTKDRVGREVTFEGRRGPDAHDAIGERHVKRAGIGIRIHRHRFNTKLTAGADDPHGNFAAIGYQQATKHTRCLSFTLL
jgi:hypothetical protein